MIDMDDLTLNRKLAETFGYKLISRGEFRQKMSDKLDAADFSEFIQSSIGKYVEDITETDDSMLLLSRRESEITKEGITSIRWLSDFNYKDPIIFAENVKWLLDNGWILRKDKDLYGVRNPKFFFEYSAIVEDRTPEKAVSLARIKASEVE